MGILLNVAIGLNNSTNFVRWRREESTVRAGANEVQAGFLQPIFVGYAFGIMKEFAPARELFGRVLDIGFIALQVPFIGISLILNAKFVHQGLKNARENGNLIYNYFPSFIKKVVYVAEVAFEKTSQAIEEHFWLRRAVYLIHDNVGNVAQVAVIASAVGLIAMGSIPTGATILALTATDFLCQHGLLPFAVRSRFYPLVITASIVTRLFFGTVFEKGFAAFEVGLIVYDFFAKKDVEEVDLHPPITGQKLNRCSIVGIKNLTSGDAYLIVSKLCEWGLVNDERKEETKALLKGLQSVQEVIDCLRDDLHLEEVEIVKVLEEIKAERLLKHVEVNRAHIQPSKLQEEPEIDLEMEVEALIARVSFDNANVLMKRGEIDEELRKRIKKGEVRENPEAIKDYVIAGIRKLSHKIVHQKILTGEPKKKKDYDTLRIMAKCIVEKLRDEDPITIEDALINLGLAGHYCGSGFFREVNLTYNLLVSGKEENLLDKLGSVLRLQRGKLFDGVLKWIELGAKTRGKHIDVQDIHVRNQFESLWASDFGLSSYYGTQADHGVDDTPTTKFFAEYVPKMLPWVMNQVMKRISPFKMEVPQFDFSEFVLHGQYTPAYILDAVYDEINMSIIVESGSQISYEEEIKVWFSQWISDTKEISIEEAEMHFQKEVLLWEDPKNFYGCRGIKKEFVLLMLIEMGILKVSPRSSLYKKIIA